MSRPLRLAAGACALLAAAVLLDCASPGSPSRESAPAAGRVDPAATDAGPHASPEVDPMAHVTVTVYFPAAGGEGLVGETREIFQTAAPGDRAKQVIADLIEGPLTEGALRALPAGTQLRQVYVIDAEGVAWLDFTAELKESLSGGSLQELLTVYAIVNSVVLNVPEIQRVGFLINGQPTESLGGHMDLSQPLPAERDWLLDRAEGALDA